MQLRFFCSVVFLLVILWSCVSPQSPTNIAPEPEPEHAPPQEEEILPLSDSEILDDALRRRGLSSIQDLDPASLQPDLVHLGLLASGALNSYNDDDPASMESDEPEDFRGILEDLWQIYSRRDLVRRMDERMKIGLPSSTREALRKYAQNPNLSGIDEDWADPVRHLLANAPYYSVHKLDIYELGRLSSMARWGRGIGYLSDTEARMVLEDIGRVLVARDWGFPEIADAQVAGIEHIYRDYSDHSARARNRAILAYELLRSGPWTDDAWQAARTAYFSQADDKRLPLPSYASIFEDLSGIPPEFATAERRALSVYHHEYRLYRAVLDEDYREVHNIVSRYSIIDEPLLNIYKWTGLAINSPQILQYLIDQGFDHTSQTGNLQATPLHLASKLAAHRSIEILLNSGADPNALTSYGESPIFWAIMHNDRIAVELLLESGAKLDIVNYLDRTPLADALAKDSDEIAQVLLYWGANPRVRLEDGVSGLARVIGQKKWDLAVALLQAGADPQAQTDDGTGIILRSLNLWYDQTFAQREKLGQGINGLDAEFSAAVDRLFGLIPPEGDPVDSDGRNILWYLRRFASQAQIETELTRHQSIAPALLSNAVSFNIASTFLYRDLRQAFADYLPRVRDISYQNSAGSSLVYLSVSEEARYWALPALLERNPDLNQVSYSNYTPLGALLYNREFELFVQLVEHGADINSLYEKQLRPIFSSFLAYIAYEKPPLDYAKELILRLIDLGGKLQFYDGVDPEYWRMPYDYLEDSYFEPIRADILRRAVENGQTFVHGAEEVLAAVDRGEFLWTNWVEEQPWLRLILDRGVWILRFPETEQELARVHLSVEEMPPGGPLRVRLDFSNAETAPDKIVLTSVYRWTPLLVDPAKPEFEIGSDRFMTIGGEPGILLDIHLRVEGEWFFRRIHVSDPKFVR